jgi:hypothetical protein
MPTHKKSAAPGAKADPRFAPVVAAFARTAGFSIMESKSGATRGLMFEGKSFGMSSHGRFILKLDEARVAELVAKGVGLPFSPAPGRLMKGWIEITQAKADWIGLAREAHAIAVRLGHGKAPAKKLAAKKPSRAPAKKVPAKKAVAKPAKEAKRTS